MNYRIVSKRKDVRVAEDCSDIGILLQDKRISVRYLIEHFIYIIDKNGDKVLLKLNRPQEIFYHKVCERLYQMKPCYFIILKARQHGITTIIEALGIIFVLFRKNQSGIIMANTNENANKIFAKLKYSYDNLKTKEKRDTIEQYIEAYKTKPKKDDQLFKLMSAVQSTDPVRLKSILSKTAIAANNPKDEILLKQIKEVHCKFIFEELQENFLYGLLGFIEHKQKRNSGWEITYDEFTAKVQELTNLYRTKSVVFPKVEALSLAEEKYLDSLFVKKIREIEYDDEILDAMTYYHKTMQFISNECIKYRVPKYAIESYSENLKEDFKIKYKIASRKSNVSDLIQCSQNFYDEIKSASAPQFYEFLQTPLFFKNGVMHLLMDDKKDGLKWLLKI